MWTQASSSVSAGQPQGSGRGVWGCRGTPSEEPSSWGHWEPPRADCRAWGPLPQVVAEPPRSRATSGATSASTGLQGTGAHL